MAETWDVVVVGGGTAGLPCAIFAAQRGARVLVLEHAPQVGGTLHYSAGQMSAAGTKRQKHLGIVDSPERHFADIMQLSRHTADPTLLRLAVEHAAETADWLEDLGYEPLLGHPLRGLSHESYSERRSMVSEEGGLDIRKAVVRLFDRLVSEGRITLQSDTEVTALVQEKSGKVCGVVAHRSDGAVNRVSGRNVVLATGGFNANPALYKELMNRPQYAAFAYPYARGTGTKLAMAAGGRVRGAEKYLCQFGPILESDEEPARLLAWADVGVTDRKPWEVYVNAHGERFVAEDVPSIHERESALLQQPDCRFWIVFDEGIAQAAPSIVHGWSKEGVMAAFATQRLFYRAETLHELANKAGIDPTGLAETIANYNEYVSTRRDPLGRLHLPQAIEQPPFYAIRCQGTTAGSCAGIAVDDKLRVIDADERPIPGLYAAGEILGSAQLMGQAFCGGMMVTPALTFGRLLGESLLNWSNLA